MRGLPGMGRPLIVVSHVPDAVSHLPDAVFRTRDAVFGLSDGEFCLPDGVSCLPDGVFHSGVIACPHVASARRRKHGRGRRTR